MVATDIAARGIHVDDVALVVHADPPVEHKAYLHRSGRTARAGNDGTVITLMTDDQVRDVRALTRAAGINPTTTRIDSALHPMLTRLAPGARTTVAGGLGVAPSDESGRNSGGGRNRGRRSAGGSGNRSGNGGGNGQRARGGNRASKQGSSGSSGRGQSRRTSTRSPGGTHTAASFSSGRR